MKNQRWFLGTTLLKAGQGGIARVARMTAKTLIEAGNNPGILSLIDDTPVEIVGKKTVSAKGSRLNYAARCHAAALSYDRFLYDSVGTARAHPRLLGLRKPYGVWIHGVEVWDSLSPDRARALYGADFVLVNSQFTLDKFQNIHGPLDNAHVCWLATEDDTAPEVMPDFSGAPTALLIGRSDKDNFRKGHKEVVESWEAVTQTIPNAQLLIAGGGDGLDVLKKTVAMSPVHKNIKVLGFVPEPDIPALWKQAHVFVQPSWKEGFGLVYIEAMRHGLPVIASIHDAGQEVTLDGETGYNVDLKKQGQLAERIIHLLQNPDEAKRLGQAGHKRWKKHFQYRAFQKRLSKELL